MCNKFTASLLLLLWLVHLPSQDCQELSPSQSGSTLLTELLGEDSEGITAACLLAAGDDFLSARITYRGFTEKEYLLAGQLLDANRRKIPGCEPIRIPLQGGATSADLSFRFSPEPATYSSPYVEVRYLKVSISEADDPLAELDLGGINLTGTSAEYRLDHRFRVGAVGNGTSNVTVSVAFTPVKRAATIKQ